VVQFLAITTQKGEGCDYSIGCGWNYESIDANSMDEAWEKYITRWADYDPAQGGECDPRKGGPGDDWSPIAGVRLIRIAEEDSSRFDPWYEAAVSAYESKESAEQDAQERAEFERLREKFG